MKKHSLQKQDHAAVWKKKLNCPIRGAYLTKMFYTTLNKVMTTKNINWNCIRESAKLPLRNITQILKNISKRKKNKNDTKLSTECWMLANKKLHPRLSSIKKKASISNKPPTHKIVDDRDKMFLNKTLNVISQCCHWNKYKLKTLVTTKKDHGIVDRCKYLAAVVHKTAGLNILEIPRWTTSLSLSLVKLTS